jgi:hypothetical protein
LKKKKKQVFLYVWEKIIEEEETSLGIVVLVRNPLWRWK